MSDDEQAASPDNNHYPVAKLSIVGIERLIKTPGDGLIHRRVWVQVSHTIFLRGYVWLLSSAVVERYSLLLKQGHVVSFEESSPGNNVAICLDDGTAIAWVLVSESLQTPNIGDYVMLIASIHPPSVRRNLSGVFAGYDPPPPPRDFHGAFASCLSLIQVREPAQRVEAHQLIPLQDPNREV